jgi:hypothetical protein
MPLPLYGLDAEPCGISIRGDSVLAITHFNRDKQQFPAGCSSRYDPPVPIFNGESLVKGGADNGDEAG